MEDGLGHPRMPALAAAMHARLDQLAGELLDRSREVLPEIWLDPAMTPAIVEYTRESIRAELDCLAAGGRIPETMPEPDIDGTRQTAQFGFPLRNLLWGYRRGHSAQWDAWLDLVEGDETLSPAERRSLLEAGSAFFFAYADRLMDLVTETYTAERERVLASREQRRVQLVRELLEGGPVDDVALDYPLEALHVGLVAWGPDAAAAIDELATRTRRRLLMVPALDDVWWAWLGGAGELPATATRALAEAAPPPGTGLAVGLSAHGPDGFRTTHEQAEAAHRAAVRAGAAVVRFADVALEELAAADATAARAFVARELAGLDSADARSDRLRDTLRAYFAAGHNAAAAAAALGIHEQTVAARLRAVEERTGRPVALRRAELETALRLRDYLGAGDHTAGGSPETVAGTS
jgi:hypothetical protein